MPNQKPFLTVLSLGVITAFCLAGCATSTGFKKAENAGDKMAALRDDVQAVQEAIQRTTESMETVVSQAADDPKKSFAKFSRAVDGLQSADAKVKERLEQIEAEKALYLQQWETDIASVQNPQVRELSEERKTAITQSFEKLNRVTAEVREDLDPWISDIRDLRTFLSNDLTAAGIQAVAGLIDQVKAKSQGVAQSLDKLVQELDATQNAVTPGGSAPVTQAAMAR